MTCDGTVGVLAIVGSSISPWRPRKTGFWQEDTQLVSVRVPVSSRFVYGVIVSEPMSSPFLEFDPLTSADGGERVMTPRAVLMTSTPTLLYRATRKATTTSPVSVHIRMRH
jgi:hypothetical protein